MQDHPVKSLSPFVGLDVRWLLETQAAQLASRTALVWSPFVGAPKTWTYSELLRDARAFSAGLARRGVGVGQRIILHTDNCPEFLIGWLGCALAGVVPVTTNAKSSADELAFFADRTDAVAAITQSHFVGLVGAACPRLAWIAAIPGDGERLARDEDFAGLLAEPNDAPWRAFDPDAPFGIQFTSGTTSRPKAVLWTHANALWGARVSAAHEQLTSNDRHLVTMPLFHTNAQVYSVLASLWVGATIVLQPRFSASRFWDVAVRHACTFASVVPFCVRALMAQPKPERHSFRYWGNAVCEPPTDQHFGVKTIGWWGMTETITHGTVGFPDLPNRPMSMGRPSPYYEILVVGGDGQPIRAGETGDLLIRGVRGLSIFSSYFADDAATQSAFDERGYFITGDRVTLAEDGFMVFADRSKDMLKVGGENVAASEVERVIAAVPGVLEVAVVAAPDAMLDETPFAFVIAAPGIAADRLKLLIDAACARDLATFKHPSGIRIVESLPRSTLGKVAKAELRALLR